jgi:alpha-ketoglutarate-dependent taurine dioxygenase
MEPQPVTQSAKKMPGIRRQPVTLSQEGIVKVEPPHAYSDLPLVISAVADGVRLSDWLENHRELIEAQLFKHGAILFRRFNVNSAEAFKQVVKAMCGDMMEYRERSSPRSQVSEKIYTSTDYPEDQSIFPHNEHSYSRTFPLKLFFCCVTPARQGGYTPLADTRKILARLSPQLRDRFIEKKWMLVRNYGAGFGLPWQTVFQTEDRAVVEQYCRKVGIECEWKENNGLRTRQVRPVVIRHPRTGEPTWFNHATFFHVTTLEPMMRDALLAEFNEDDLPTNSYYGDGSPIEPHVLDELRAAYLEELITFPWEAGSVVLLDNVLTSHSRTPYSGPRKVLFAMADPIDRTDF